MDSRSLMLGLLLAPLVAGCGAAHSGDADSPERAPCPACASAAGPLGSGPPVADPVVVSPSEADAPPAGGVGDEPAAAGRVDSLPEVAVENVGLHVGGGPNDDATKAPFQDAIGARFEDFRRCYAKVSEPGQGGVFGVDLRIGRDGGRPTIQQARTGMGGEEFRECVKGVFADTEFEKPPRGPTVISYSIRFTVGGK